MALWQYTFQVLLKKSATALSENLVFNRDEEGFDDEPYWKFNHTDKSFFSALSKILPKVKSWSYEIDLYGDQESNCFEVLHDKDNAVISVSFRIDFTSNYESVLNSIIEFCIFNGLIILDESLNVVYLNYEVVKSIIMNSHQAKMYNILTNRQLKNTGNNDS
jgi:hypothetical protein